MQAVQHDGMAQIGAWSRVGQSTVKELKLTLRSSQISRGTLPDSRALFSIVSVSATRNNQQVVRGFVYVHAQAEKVCKTHPEESIDPLRSAPFRLIRFHGAATWIVL